MNRLQPISSNQVTKQTKVFGGRERKNSCCIVCKGHSSPYEVYYLSQNEPTMVILGRILGNKFEGSHLPPRG